MTAFLAIAGAGLLFVAAIDIVGSLLGDTGRGGWYTGAVARTTWRALAPSRRRGRHGPSHLIGRLIILATPLSWLLTTWVGWTLVFAASPSSVVSADDGAATTAAEKTYFVGYSLFTLGNGEFRPSGTTWQMATAVATLSGFSILTLAVTFVIPVVQAATLRRQTASLIAAHGTTHDEIGDALARGAIDASTVAAQIIELAEAHAAFPVLHYLHTTDERRSAPAMIANLALASSHTSPDTARSMTVINGALQHYLHLHPFAAHATGDVWTWIRRDDGREP